MKLNSFSLSREGLLDFGTSNPLWGLFGLAVESTCQMINHFAAALEWSALVCIFRCLNAKSSSIIARKPDASAYFGDRSVSPQSSVPGFGLQLFSRRQRSHFPLSFSPLIMSINLMGCRWKCELSLWLRNGIKFYFIAQLVGGLQIFLSISLGIVIGLQMLG